MKILFLTVCFFSFIYADSLKEYHNYFLNLDVHAKHLDLKKEINAIRKARSEFPLDDKLKMVDMELENRLANEEKHPPQNRSSITDNSHQ